MDREREREKTEKILSNIPGEDNDRKKINPSEIEKKEHTYI